ALLTALSAALWWLAGLAYARRPEAWEAATLFPCWLWAIAGVGLLMFGWDRRLKPIAIALLVVWVAFLATFAGESRGLLRRRRWRDCASTLERSWKSSACTSIRTRSQGWTSGHAAAGGCSGRHTRAGGGSWKPSPGLWGTWLARDPSSWAATSTSRRETLPSP